MFNSLRGELTYKHEDRICIVTNGIEWEVLISRHTFEKLPAEGNECRIFCYLHHREDSLKLFGFQSPVERDLFLNLLKVEGIGPSLAIKILSGITAEACIRAVENQDLVRLSDIPGLGRKTAQKIILKLAGKLTPLKQGEPCHEDIVKALHGMGFEMQRARDAVSRAAASLASTRLPQEHMEKELLKGALLYLSGKEEQE
jgi:Holliday junction DNA helicase RuvA